jgi:glutamate synthase domain-containing protein 3
MTPEELSRPVVHLVDQSSTSVRETNALLQAATEGSFSVTHPAGRHNLAVGLAAELDVEIDGHVGYYCAGMNAQARVHVRGNVGTGVAENIMSGSVVVDGDASQSAGATGHGGLVVIHGNASARCGISMKGVDIVVRGSVGHLSAFMAQSGRLLVCGDTGGALGDSLYEARLYVRGSVESLGADCVEKAMEAQHLAEVAELLARAEIDDVDPADFRRYGSARTLYSFQVDDAGPYQERS